MARTPASVAASRIRIEDEVWEEAFSTRVPSRRSRTSASVRPARPVAGPVTVDSRGPLTVDSPVLRMAEPPVVTAVSAFPDAPAEAFASASPSGARRTVRIQGRGADPYRVRAGGDAWTPQQVFPVARSLGSSPDRLAMWAALLGFLLVVVALLSSHF